MSRFYQKHIILILFCFGIIFTGCAEQPKDEEITNDIGMKFRLVQPGKFMMGSTGNEKDRDTDEIQHEVVISKAFYMGVTEVTQAQFKEVMGTNPSNWKGENLPVERVTWNEAKEFCEKLSEKDPNMTYRLPTEAEWEYACRAGTDTWCYWGNDLNHNMIDQYAFYKKNSGFQTNEVGQKKPNLWGLYDMSGNVWEWCSDWKGDYPTEKIIDPAGTPSGSFRVVRGGSWLSLARDCRSANRNDYSPDDRNSNVGFRLVLLPAQ